MNSRQRRVDRRLWKYSVPLYLIGYEQYIDIWDWLKSRYGSKVTNCGWRDRLVYYAYDDSLNTLWQFDDEKKYIEFILRWA